MPWFVDGETILLRLLQKLIFLKLKLSTVWRCFCGMGISWTSVTYVWITLIMQCSVPLAPVYVADSRRKWCLSATPAQAIYILQQTLAQKGKKLGNWSNTIDFGAFVLEFSSVKFTKLIVSCRYGSLRGHSHFWFYRTNCIGAWDAQRRPTFVIDSTQSGMVESPVVERDVIGGSRAR